MAPFIIRFTRLTCLARLTLFAMLSFTALGSGPSQAQVNATEAAAGYSQLNADLLYELLVSELNAQQGDMDTAYSMMLNAARKTHSEQLYERAVTLALNARNGEAALTAARAWVRNFPPSPAANRYLLQLLVGLNRLPETVEPMRQFIAATPAADRVAVIGSLPRYFSHASDRDAASQAVQTALSSQLDKPATGATAWATVGVLRLQAGRGQDALDALRRGAAWDRESEDLAALALGLMDAKQPSAETYVEQALSGTKPRPQLHMAYIRRLILAQRTRDALAQADRLTRSQPDTAAAWLILGSLQLEESQYAAAEASLTRCVSLLQSQELAQGVELNRELTQAYLLLSQTAQQAGRPEQARAYLDKITADPSDIRVYIQRAGLLAKEGRIQEALTLIRTAPETQPDDARQKIVAELKLLRDGQQHAQAYDLLAQAVRRFPADVDLMYEQAMTADKLGRFDDMERLLRAIIATKPDYHHAYNALGYSLADRKLRLIEAHQLITKALEYAPDDPFILDSLGWVEFRSGNLAEAVRILRSAFTARPDAEIAAHLGEALWAMERKDEARAVWRQGQVINPQNETLQETVRRLDRP